MRQVWAVTHDSRGSAAQLAAALMRVLPYADRLPAGAAAEVRAALDAYDEAKRTKCNHEAYSRVDGRCGSCGEAV